VARLRRADPSGPGLTRRRAGRGFVYLDEGGRILREPAHLERIRALVIPPAWNEVWICPDARGHIQAMGTDNKGRRQYRYHDAWRVKRDRDKFDHVLEVAAALPGIRRRCQRHLEEAEPNRERVLAAAVRLLDIGFFRVGGEQYVEENGSYGLATLLRSHARIRGRQVVFDYPAKSGQHRLQGLVDDDVREVVRILKARRSGGPELLAYRERGRWKDVTSADINTYLREVSGLDVTAKDFRTWNATVLAAVALAVSWEADPSRRAQDRAVRRAVCEVADYLGNTPTVCRTSYIDPRVIDLYRAGTTIRPALGRLGSDPGAPLSIHGAAERATLTLLR
jgi:DNA topoisomerase IB